MKRIISLLLIVIMTLTIEYTPINADTDMINNYSSAISYDTKRIIVYTDFLTDNYNSISSSYLYGAFTLEYKTVADTVYAYNNLVSDYGYENVIVDQTFNLYSFNQEDYIEQPIYELFPSVRGGNYELIKDINNYQGNKNEIIVGVIDSGVDSDTVFYGNRYLMDKCTSFIDDGDYTIGNPEDSLGHGSSVCFAIANSSPENVKIIAYKIFDSEGNSSITAVREALYQAYEDGVDIINMSWGGDSTFATLDRDIKKLYNANISMVAAVGNDGTETADDIYPAYSNYTIAVSSISNEKVDNKYKFSEFSNYGTCVDFSSPGERLSLCQNDEKFYYCSGTSYATPVLVGQLATLKTVVSTSSVSDDIDLLKKYISSDFDDDYVSNTDYKNNKYGFGYLDFNNTRLCTCGQSYCHLVYHDDVEDIPIETTTSVENSSKETTTIDKSNITESSSNADNSSIKDTSTDSSISIPTTTITPTTTNSVSETTSKMEYQKNSKVEVPKNLKLRIKKRSLKISYKKRKEKDRVIIYIKRRKKGKAIKKIVTKNSRIKYILRKKGYYYVRIRTVRIIGKRKYYSKLSKFKRIKY